MNQTPVVGLRDFLCLFDFIGRRFSLRTESKIEFWDWDWNSSDQGISWDQSFIFTIVYFVL